MVLQLDTKIELEMITSIMTVILVILAVAIFIKYHARTLFYIVVVITLILGFLNAWLISTVGERGARMSIPRARTRKKSRK